LADSGILIASCFLIFGFHGWTPCGLKVSTSPVRPLGNSSIINLLNGMAVGPSFAWAQGLPMSSAQIQRNPAHKRALKHHWAIGLSFRRRLCRR
jgi:hypothetical protein